MWDGPRRENCPIMDKAVRKWTVRSLKTVVQLGSGRAQNSPDYITTSERLARSVINVCTSFAASPCRSDRSTPQKLSSNSKDWRPTWSSFGPSCRTQEIRNCAFFNPRWRLTVVPASNFVRSEPTRAPVCVMSTVCAKCVALSIKTFTDRTILLRFDFRFSNIGPLLSRPNPSSKSYRSLADTPHWEVKSPLGWISVILPKSAPRMRFCILPLNGAGWSTRRPFTNCPKRRGAPAC